MHPGRRALDWLLKLYIHHFRSILNSTNVVRSPQHVQEDERRASKRCDTSVDFMGLNNWTLPVAFV
jgi:hypothetical protein